MIGGLINTVKADPMRTRAIGPWMACLATPRIESTGGLLAARTLDEIAHAIVLVPAEGARIAALPYGDELARRMQRARFTFAEGVPFVTELPNARGTRVALAGIKPGHSAFELLTTGRALIKAMASGRPERLLIAAAQLNERTAARAREAVLAAALAQTLRLPEYKSKPEKTRALREILVLAPGAPDYARTLAAARGNNLARYLTALPANQLTPASYRTRVQQLARRYQLRTEFMDMKKLRARGAGAFLAVAQGSPEPDAGILRLRYTPRKNTTGKSIALVGKGICFDTGGTNLKTARYMHGMHEDMQGSAVALGTLLALTELKVDFTVDCWLALAQNHIGPKAYKQNEVVTAANGTTIEIMHTDAEGRMVLADTLYFASLNKPGLILDFATLTGSCIGALGTRVSGALTDRAALIPRLINAGEASGERVWPFPLYDDYAEALKSDVADVKQCTLENEADHILAGAFLKKFLAHDLPWIHVDLSAGNHKDGLGHVPTEVTGFGVRFALNLLLNQKIL